MNQTQMQANDQEKNSAGNLPANEDTLLDIHDLSVIIRRDEDVVTPLNQMNLRINSGQSVGIVGESGCGKTMTAYGILRALPGGSEIVSGTIRYKTKDDIVVDLAALPRNASLLRRIRGGEISMIFQEPMSAFSSVHTIHNQLAEMIRLHRKMNRLKTRAKILELLDLVGIPDPVRCADDYPFQLSGGMCQRAMIAMALSSQPRLLIADEPTTALDVTVQAQVLHLIQRIQSELNLALMLITHDLGVVAHMVEYIYIMYLGRVVEQGPVRAIFHNPSHPYTIALQASIPSLTRKSENLRPITGSVPSAGSIPAGCSFHPRCSFMQPGLCDVGDPPPLEETGLDHKAACWRWREVANIETSEANQAG